MSRNSVMETVTAIVAALVLVFALGAIGIRVFGSTPEAEEKTQAEVQESVVSAAPIGEAVLPAQANVVMPISEVDYDSSCTLIPVNIEGTTEDNKTISQLQFCNGIGDGVKLLPGTYRMTFPAGYITGSGKVYRAPEGTIRAVIPAEIADGESVRAIAIPPREQFKDNYVSDEIREAAEAAANSSIILEFTEVPLLDVTQEMLDEISSYTKQDPSDNGKTQAACETVLSLQRKAISEQEEAKRKAEAEEKARIAEEQRLAAEEEARIAMEEQRRAVEEEARKAAEEEAKKKEEEEAAQRKKEEEEKQASAPASSSMLDGWWSLVNGGESQHTYFHNGIADVYDDGSASGEDAHLVSTSSVQICERLTSDQEKVVGEGGYLIYLEGSSCYVIHDSAPEVMELRSYPDLRNYNADKSVIRATPPDNVLALVK